MDLCESTVISTTPSGFGANGTYDSYVLSGMGYSPLNISQTVQLQNTVYLAPIKLSQIKGSVIWCNH